jgi:N-hydroxyarylamine O-acetyltransferase
VNTLDLGAYATRIGYDGDFAPSLRTLRALHRLHPQALAFENLSPLTGEVPALDLPTLQDKLLHGRRGGWCFEHNLLFAAVLREAGFAVTGLAARVLWGNRPQAEAARSHMLLQVKAEGASWLADVGFGGLSLTAPLQMIADVVQDTPHESFVLRRDASQWLLHACLPEGEAPLYRFDLTPQDPIDYAYANWYLATHPSSHFLKNLFAARSAEGGRHALLNGEYSWRPLGAPLQRQQVASVEALRALLDERFGVTLPPGAAIDARLAPLLHNVRADPAR